MSKEIEQQSVFSLSHFIGEYFDLKRDKEGEKETIASIEASVSFKGARLWILVFAIFICSLGLSVNSTAVIIGAMLISPLMGPIMGIGLSAGIYDFELMKRSFKNFFVATFISIAASSLFFLVNPVAEGQSELLARTSPNIYDVFIALLGGLGAFIAVSTKEKGNVIPGAAIATALMPPLCTAGFGLATGNLMYFLGALYLYFINTVFISVAAKIGVMLLHFSPKEFINKEKGKRVHRYILIIAISTILPAGYLTVGIVQNSIEKRNIEEYLSAEFTFPSTHIVDQKIVDYEGQRVLRLLLVGKEISEDAIEQARNKMKDYNLKKLYLQVEQGTNNTKDINTLKAMVMEDFYKNSEKRLAEQAEEIKMLQDELSQYRHYDELGSKLVPELKVLYPSIENITLSKGVEYDINSSRQDTIAIVVMQMNADMPKDEKGKLTDWLKTRVGCNKLRMLITR